MVRRCFTALSTVITMGATSCIFEATGRLDATIPVDTRDGGAAADVLVSRDVGDAAAPRDIGDAAGPSDLGDAAGPSDASDAGPSHVVNLEVYLKAGSRGTAGTAASPVGTLDDVKEVIRLAAPSGAVEIHIYPDTYIGQRMTWDLPIVSGQTITFRPWEGESGWPRFVGEELGDQTFFSLHRSVSPGGPTNLRFWHLKIENYKDGISLAGPVDDKSMYNGENQIVDCRFRNIGDIHVSSASTAGYGALKLTNSRNNVVRFNRFEYVENGGEVTNQDLIHGIYAAHWSTSNDIRFNFFNRISGDSIKTRDQSGSNIVRGNVFWHSGSTAQFGDWYCNAESVSTCRTQEVWESHGDRWECPSFGNDCRYNDYGKSYDDSVVLPVFLAVREEDDPDYSNIEGFPPYACPLHEDARFHSYGNDYQANWSTMSEILSAWESPGGPLYDWRVANGIQ